MNATNRLVEYISKIKYSDLPQEVINLTKEFIIDTIGSIIYSSQKDWSKIIIKMIQEYNYKGYSTVIPFGFKTSAASAALANGTMAHGFELDDGHVSAKVHPGSVVIPAALVVSEQESVDGRNFLLSIVMGYEVMCRVSRSIDPKNHIMAGFHPTGTTGPFGGAISAGKSIGLTREQLLSALGIAGSLGSGIMRFSKDNYETGDMIKRLHSGRASEGGVLSALLAKNGFKGPSDIFEGKYGFCDVYSKNPKIEFIVQNLGKTFEVRNIYLKPYPCCKTLLPIVDGILELKNRYKIDIEHIKCIQIKGNEKLNNFHKIYDIDSTIMAQFSAPFCTALTLISNAQDPDNYSKNKYKNVEINNAMKKVEIVRDKKFDAIYDADGVEINIHLLNGEQLKAEIVYPKGHPKNKLNSEQIYKKFETLTKSVISSKTSNQIVEMVNNIENISDMNEFTSLFTRN